MRDVCGNCGVGLEGRGSTRTISLNEKSNKYIRASCTSMSIYKALAIIFRNSPLALAKLSLGPGQDNYNEELFMNQTSGYSICLTCSKLLTELYECYQSFLAVGKADSEIGKILNGLTSSSNYLMNDGRDEISFVKVEREEERVDEFSQIRVDEMPSRTSSSEAMIDAIDESDSRHSPSLRRPKRHAAVVARKKLKRVLEFSEDESNKEEYEPSPPKTGNWNNFTTDKSSQDKEFSCSQCGMSFLYENTLQCHLKIIHNNVSAASILPILPVPRKVPMTSSNQLTVPSKRTSMCPFCHVTVPRGEIKNHLSLHTNISNQSAVFSNKSEHSYKLCGITFPLRQQMAEHMLTHKQKKPFQCKFCHRKYDRVDQLRLHVKRFHNNGPPSVKRTSHEDEELMDVENGVGDIIIEDDNEESIVEAGSSPSATETGATTAIEPFVERRFLCNPCGLLDFVTAKELNKHMLETHGNMDSLTCSICQKQVTDTFCLTLHLQTHTITKPFSCYMCEMNYKDKDDLFYHLMDNHLLNNETIVGKYPDVFKKQIKNASGSKKIPPGEIIKVPTMKKFFVCEICGKEYPSAAVLKNHKRLVHDKIKDFICSYCGKSFARRSYFLIHEKLHTTTEADYKCHLCGKGFRLATCLRAHLKSSIHSSEKKFVCETCGKSFNRIDNLRIHVRTVHLKIRGRLRRGDPTRYTTSGPKRMYGPDQPAT